MDRLVYKDALDYEALFREVGTELLTSNRTQDVATAVADRLVEALHLESALVFLGEEPARTALAAGVGGRSAEIRRHWNPEIATYTEDGVDRQLLDIRVGPDSLLLATMTLSDRYLGYLLLGPKERGEVFVEQEKRLVANLTRGDGAGRIARDLHDGPLQIAMLLGGMVGVPIPDRPELARRLGSEIREICARLRPSILDDLGLVPALEWLLSETSEDSQLSTSLAMQNIDEQDRFSDDVELALFRVTQEATNNAVKHSKGTSMDVSLSKEGGSLVLRVADNGKGFAAPLRSTGGFGFIAMRERVVQLYGSFDVLSAPGLGTTVIASIPLADEPEPARVK